MGYLTRFSASFTYENQRVKGIEPSCAAWEAAVLPLNYTRGEIFDFRLPICDLQAANNHCQEITSSDEFVEFLSPEPPSPSLPSDHAITPIVKFGVAPALAV